MESKRAGSSYSSYEGLRKNIIDYLNNKSDVARERDLCYGLGCQCSDDREGESCGGCVAC